MPRPARPTLEREIATLFSTDDQPELLARRVVLCQELIEIHGCVEVLTPLLAEASRHLRMAAETLDRQQAIITRLTARPHPVATFLGWIAERSARVLHQAGERVVGVRDELNVDGWEPGDTIMLAEAGNVILERCEGASRAVELAAFESALADGTLLVRHRDERIALRPLGGLRDVAPVPGDEVRFDRQSGYAFAIVPRVDRPVWLREAPPMVTREAVGGLDDCLDRLLHALSATLTEPERAQRYELSGHRTILLHGPPGVGKTLSATWAVSTLARLTGKRLRYMAIKPAEFDSKWVGETESNVRRAFAELQSAAREDGFVVAYFDEIESIARIRGGALALHHDRALTALLAEVDGFRKLGNVALIFSTNRKDLLDPAALERFASIDIRVPRPSRRAAREIFGVHLPDRLPFSPNGADAPATREQLIDAAVSRLYSPNADNAVCRLRFRDGKDRVITASELVSGRLIQQITGDARERAFRRDIQTNEAGVRLDDVDAAVDSALERLRTTLSIHNAHAYLDDLPQDMPVVAVDPLGRRVRQPHRYLNP
ncbi:MAG TPA: AAA family ATPase [Chthoniobacteraceae bacterium]|jgi:ATP-dependent 26S proteasome regulatory subunit|nr:AAA family ATPase [Chthoniobacteraceae bacterium]